MSIRGGNFGGGRRESASNDATVAPPSGAKLVVLPADERDGPPYNQLSNIEKYRLYRQKALTFEEQGLYLEEVASQMAAARRFIDEGKLSTITVQDIDDTNWPPSGPNGGVDTLVGLSQVEQVRFYLYKIFDIKGAFRFYNTLGKGQYIDTPELKERREKNEWDQLSINQQDALIQGGGRQVTPYQRQLWKDAYNAAGVIALKEINAKQWVTAGDLDYRNNTPGLGWSTDPNVTDMTNAPRDNVTGRVFWDTGRFTVTQALKYLNNTRQTQIDEDKKSKCDKYLDLIDWTNPSTIAPNIKEYIKCKIEEKIPTLEIILFAIIALGLPLAIGLYRSGAIGYAGRAGIATAEYAGMAAVGLSGAGPIVGGGQYLLNKKRIAAQNQSSVGVEVSKDLTLAAVNPAGFAFKVIGEQVNK